MTSPTPTSPDRALRADARRNRDVLLATARAAFAAEGATASLEGIARAAGVGIGTLYRHFPTREALVEAAYGAELDDLAASAPVLLDDLDPDAALREWVVRYAEFTATKRGMMVALRAGLAEEKLPSTATRERITTAIGPILTAGAARGCLRDDVVPDDVTSLLLGVFLVTASGSTPEQTRRLLDLVVDGLRPGSSPGSTVSEGEY